MINKSNNKKHDRIGITNLNNYGSKMTIIEYNNCHSITVKFDNGYIVHTNYYNFDKERLELDKDILHKGNKIYNPIDCIFAPKTINTLFIQHKNKRNNLPIGVCLTKQSTKFQSKCMVRDYNKKRNKKVYLGLYNTPEEAFNAYKQFKEKYIKQVADEYKDKIPKKLYDAMYRYEVEITD